MQMWDVVVVVDVVDVADVVYVRVDDVPVLCLYLIWGFGAEAATVDVPAAAAAGAYSRRYQYEPNLL